MAQQANEDDVSKLFSAEPGAVPAVLVSSSGGGHDGASPSDPVGFGSLSPRADLNTLDEPVWETFKRDIGRIFGNIKIVVLPCCIGRQRSTALRNWDLWGPLVFMLSLATLIVSGEDHDEEFPIVFATLGFGALVLTLNVVLLGGSIVFFQSLCLIGYCLFPLVLSALACVFLPGTESTKHAFLHLLLRFVVVLTAVLWSFWATFPFVAESVPPKRCGLAVYPMLLLYTAIGWMELFST